MVDDESSGMIRWMGIERVLQNLVRVEFDDGE
jgi:hypothetical protein